VSVAVARTRGQREGERESGKRERKKKKPNFSGHGTVAQVDRAYRHGRVPSYSFGCQMGQNFGTVGPCYMARPCHPLQRPKKIQAHIRSTGPPVQTGTGPKTEYDNYLDRGPDR